MRVLRVGEALNGRQPKTSTPAMKLVPLESLPPEEQAKHRGGKKSKRARKNVWVPA